MSSKLRDALSEIIDLIDGWRTDGVMEHWQYSQLFDIADAALTEPLRNCDVGTAKEQSDMFVVQCNDYRATHGNCFGCPCSRTTGRCEFTWAQMPYESEAK